MPMLYSGRGLVKRDIYIFFKWHLLGDFSILAVNRLFWKGKRNCLHTLTNWYSQPSKRFKGKSSESFWGLRTCVDFSEFIYFSSKFYSISYLMGRILNLLGPPLVPWQVYICLQLLKAVELVWFDFLKASRCLIIARIPFSALGIEAHNAFFNSPSCGLKK